MLQTTQEIFGRPAFGPATAQVPQVPLIGSFVPQVQQTGFATPFGYSTPAIGGLPLSGFGTPLQFGAGVQNQGLPFNATYAWPFAQGAQFNPKGQKIFDGYAPGQAFKKKPGVEMVGDIKQAAQEAPDAIEVQRIPKAARDMAKGYFKNLGGQQEGQKPEAPKQ